jgi:hypothetical protein
MARASGKDCLLALVHSHIFINGRKVGAKLFTSLTQHSTGGVSETSFKSQSDIPYNEIINRIQTKDGNKNFTRQPHRWYYETKFNS